MTNGSLPHQGSQSKTKSSRPPPATATRNDPAQGGKRAVTPPCAISEEPLLGKGLLPRDRPLPAAVCTRANHKGKPWVWSEAVKGFALGAGGGAASPPCWFPGPTTAGVASSSSEAGRQRSWFRGSLKTGALWACFGGEQSSRDGACRSLQEPPPPASPSWLAPTAFLPSLPPGRRGVQPDHERGGPQQLRGRDLPGLHRLHVPGDDGHRHGRPGHRLLQGPGRGQGELGRAGGRSGRRGPRPAGAPSRLGVTT